MATVAIPQAMSQSARRSRSSVKVENSLTGSSSTPSESFIGRPERGAVEVRLSSERDSGCFTNDKIASSRTMLIDGHRAPVCKRPPHPGCRSKNSRSRGKQQVTLRQSTAGAGCDANQELKSLNHRGLRGTQRKNNFLNSSAFLCVLCG